VARFDRAIPPGGRGDIELTLKTAGFQGNLQKTAVVQTNDPKNPRITLSLSATVSVAIDIQPQGVLMEGSASDELVQAVTIRAMEPQPLVLRLANITHPEKIACELRTVEEGRVYEVFVRTLKQQRGRYAGQITLETNYPHKAQLQVLYAAVIKGKVEFQPQRLVFAPISNHRSAGGESGIEFPVRTVNVSLMEGDNLSIERLDYEQGYFEVETKAVVPNRQYQLSVKVKPEAVSASPLLKELKIYTNIETEGVLSIPIELRKP
jgi:hypothetical protein